MSPPRKSYKLPPNLTFEKIRGLYRYRNPLTGKRTYFGKNKLAAVEAAKKANTAIEIQRTQAKLNESNVPNLSYVISLYIENTVPEKPWKDSTKANKLHALEVYRREFGKRTIQGIDRVTIGDWLRDRCSTADCYNKHRELLIDIWNFAISRKIIDSNEAEKTLRRSGSKNIKSNRKQRKRLTVDQFWGVHAYAEPWLQIAMEFSLVTAQGRSEICKLKYSDIRNGFIYIIREKVSSVSDMAFIAIEETNQTKELIQKSRMDGIACPYVIHRSPASKRPQHLANKLHWAAVEPGYMTKAFAKARKETGMFEGVPPPKLPSFHEIRSLSGRILREQGIVESEIQSLMSHSDVSTTRIYLENPESIEDSRFSKVRSGINLKNLPKI